MGLCCEYLFCFKLMLWPNFPTLTLKIFTQKSSKTSKRLKKILDLSDYASCIESLQYYLLPFERNDSVWKRRSSAALRPMPTAQKIPHMWKHKSTAPLRQLPIRRKNENITWNSRGERILKRKEEKEFRETAIKPPRKTVVTLESLK